MVATKVSEEFLGMMMQKHTILPAVCSCGLMMVSGK